MSDAPMVNRPAVARPAGKTSIPAVAGSLAALGLGIFFWLSDARASAHREDQLPVLAATTSGAPAPAPVAATPPAPAPNPAGQAFWTPIAEPAHLQASPPTAPPALPIAAPPAAPSAAPPTSGGMNERLRAPALVVDLAQAEPARAPGASSTVVTDGGVRVGPQFPQAVGTRNLSDTEQFSSRIGEEEVQVAQARQMVGLDRLVPQGAVIGAVMETALNSDLPGYARAIVQRDVFSFDGSAVLIPAGSKLIGQYKSGVAQGASRVFVLWTRLTRPDGVTIELASPATDELGRGGLGGKVNRHFLQRFGGAILTSVLSGGISAASAALSGGSTIIVGGAGQATSLASQATQNSEIPPTITTKQGAAVRIFVARDLDFSSVGPAR